MNKENFPKYLYVYRESNTVIQLVFNEEKQAYILDDGEWTDEANVKSNIDAIIHLMDGARYVTLDSKEGDFWTVYTSADVAFAVNCQ